MVKAKTTARIERLQDKIGIGCALCNDRPAIHLLGENDPMPERYCSGCGRRFDEDVYVFLGIDPSVI
jgi:hypothetical protein